MNEGEIKIQLIKPYQLSKAGDILCVNQGISDLLVNRNIAILVKTKDKSKK